jgi:hypothetical protein
LPLSPTSAAPSGPQPLRRAPTRRNGATTQPLTGRTERIAIDVVAGLAGVVGAFAPGQPTGLAVMDVVLRAGFAALVTLAASRARRWTWFVVAGMAGAFAPDGAWLYVAVAALVVALAAALAPRHRIVGAVVGALAVQVLLRLPDLGFTAASALVTAVAVAPVLASAYSTSPRRVRRRIHRMLLWSGVVVGVGVVAGGVLAYLASRAIGDAVDEARDGLSAARDGETERASELFVAAEQDFDRAATITGGPWSLPARLIPVVGQHVDVVHTMSGAGRDVSTEAARTAVLADIQTLRYEDGALDVARLAALEEPLSATATELRQALDASQSLDSPWLVAPVRDRLDALEAELDQALPEAEIATLAAREGPALLGADGPRTYFVLFTTPAELRGLGGFVGNWAVLTADAGRVELSRHGRVSELNDHPGAESRTISGPDDYVARYGRFEVPRYFQDVTFSPDLPSVADVVNQLYPQMGGTPVDGVLVVDPYALAALLEFTGPIRVEGLDKPLTEKNAAEILLRDQYTLVEDRAERADLLDEASRRTFEELVSGSLPSPREVSEVLAPVVREGRLAFHSFTDGERELFGRLGADGAFAAPDGGDFFSLRTQNAANNKIDVFLRRNVDYEARFDPGSGRTEASATITLRNEAPDSGLPDAVIGSNDRGLPRGTNRSFVSFYTPLGLREARLNGEPIGVEAQRELGWWVYSSFVEIPSGGELTLELDLAGDLEPSDTYRLATASQPTVNADAVRVRVEPLGAGRVTSTDGLVADITGGVALGSLVGDRDHVATVTFSSG